MMLLTLGTFLPRPSLVFASRRGVSSRARLHSPRDKRMEALVSLYHQSDAFITPENLSAAIDQAFTQRLNVAGVDENGKCIQQLRSIKSKLRRSPKFFLGRDSSGSTSLEHMGQGFVDSRTKRMDRVYQALMGTQKDGRPSWLALKENSERVESQTDKDIRG